ncbi:hypothetical protein USDA257_c59050 [Sinorhizobium fredii USDA 257]|uniref:Uncharacterized protein n=1 Tax=Sinorhizobium fredii (strain USDA 257) TaxID=1185652 RepID=I3XEW0_SINF2|nr:hypothetical protein USDA257_c59050 [Sinorhizobium fredii USDA 257]
MRRFRRSRRYLAESIAAIIMTAHQSRAAIPFGGRVGFQ